MKGPVLKSISDLVTWSVYPSSVGSIGTQVSRGPFEVRTLNVGGGLRVPTYVWRGFRHPLGDEKACSTSRSVPRLSSKGSTSRGNVTFSVTSVLGLPLVLRFITLQSFNVQFSFNDNLFYSRSKGGTVYIEELPDFPVKRKSYKPEEP